MIERLLIALTVSCLVLSGARGADPKGRSTSGKFTVYCDDTALRGQVVGAAVQLKNDVLRMLGESDFTRFPISITLQRSSVPSAQRVELKLFEAPHGPAISIDVRFGDDPAAVNLQKHIVRAVLLEHIYRPRGIRGGETYVEPPWWVVDGIVEVLRRREHGVDPELFKRLLASSKLPPIEEFLSLRSDNLGRTARAIDGLYAMCLVQLLLDQPNGRANFSSLLRNWPDLHSHPEAVLRKEFPSLAENAAGLQKWWTLSLARFSATDRYQGLSVEETDNELSAALHLQIEVGKRGEKKAFEVAQFREYVKLRGCKAAMRNGRTALIALSSRANALFRPVIVEYEQIFAALERGKVRGVAQRLERIENYRQTVLHRIGEISDYLNWFEATQSGTRSHAFDGFLRTADSIAADEQRLRSSDPVAQYLDQLQQEL